MNLFFAFLPENGSTISWPSSFVSTFSPAILLLFSEVRGSAMTLFLPNFFLAIRIAFAVNSVQR